MPANKSIVGESRILWPGREMDIEGKGVFTLPARWCQNVTTPGGLDRKIYMMLLLDRLMTTARRPVSVKPDDGERDHGRGQGRDVLHCMVRDKAISIAAPALGGHNISFG